MTDLQRAKEEYYDGSEYENNPADIYIDELEKINAEMLEALVSLCRTMDELVEESRRETGDEVIEIIERVTGKPIEEII